MCKYSALKGVKELSEALSIGGVWEASSVAER